MSIRPLPFLSRAFTFVMLQSTLVCELGGENKQVVATVLLLSSCSVALYSLTMGSVEIFVLLGCDAAYSVRCLPLP